VRGGGGGRMFQEGSCIQVVSRYRVGKRVGGPPQYLNIAGEGRGWNRKEAAYRRCRGRESKSASADPLGI